jgi:hypothetical protein
MNAMTNQLDLSALPPSSRREVRDFYQFLLSRRRKTKRAQTTKKYNFADLCGALSWKGDAVAAQRRIRDEW